MNRTVGLVLERKCVVDAPIIHSRLGENWTQCATYASVRVEMTNQMLSRLKEELFCGLRLRLLGRDI